MDRPRPDPANRWVSRRALVGGAAGIVLVAATPRAAPAADRFGVDDWRFCRDCRGLFWAGGGRGRCPAGGGHAGAGSKNYELPHGGAPFETEETDWRRCGRCAGLFWAGDGVGRCPKGGSHALAGLENFILEFNQPTELGEESGWRYCARCRGLFTNRGGKRGVCPAGGRHAVYPGFDYNLDIIP